MIFYKLDYAIEETLKQNLTAEQLFLKKLTGERLSKSEAVFLLQRIRDHKWYVSEKLDRDVGFNVAAIDFLENIYESGGKTGNSRRGSNRRFNMKERETLLMLT